MSTSSVSNSNQNSLWKYLTGSITAQTKASSCFNEMITTFSCLNKSQRLLSSAVHKFLAVKFKLGSLGAHVCSTKTLAAVLWLLWSTGLWSKLLLWRVLHWTDSGAAAGSEFSPAAWWHREVCKCMSLYSSTSVLLRVWFKIQTFIYMHSLSVCICVCECCSEMRSRLWITHTHNANWRGIWNNQI